MNARSLTSIGHVNIRWRERHRILGLGSVVGVGGVVIPGIDAWVRSHVTDEIARKTRESRAISFFLCDLTIAVATEDQETPTRGKGDSEELPDLIDSRLTKPQHPPNHAERTTKELSKEAKNGELLR